VGEGGGASCGGGQDSAGKISSGSDRLKKEDSSFAEGGGEAVFSGREFRWERHAEKRNKIIPTTRILRIVKFLRIAPGNRGP